MLLSILFLVTHDPSESTLIMADNNKKLRPSFVQHVHHFEKGCTLHNFIPDREGLSLRGGGRGFPTAKMNMAPGYFHRKIEEKYNQKKSLAV